MDYNIKMKFSWKTLPKPFFVLAPMEGVTDTVFRQVVGSLAAPDVYFTEFTNCEGMMSKGREKVGRRLIYSGHEKPLIAQLWGLDPNAFFEVSRMVVEMGFEGVDLNMGCPVSAVVARGSCSGLIGNPTRAKEMIEATKKGVQSAGWGIPVSVKTRIGLKSITTEEWIGFLLEQNLDALTIHLRTQKEMSNVPAHFEELEKIVALRNKISPNTVLIANGDIMSKSQGKELVEKYGIDGAMIGRGVFHNPFVFDESVNYVLQTKDQRIELLKLHIDMFEKVWTHDHPLSEKEIAKLFPPLKRFFKIYISGFEGAAELREKLMSTKSIDETKKVLGGLYNISIPEANATN